MPERPHQLSHRSRALAAPAESDRDPFALCQAPPAVGLQGSQGNFGAGPIHYVSRPSRLKTLLVLIIFASVARSSALGNILAPPEAAIPQAHARNAVVATSAVFGRPPFAGARAGLGVPPPSQSTHAIQSPRAWDFKQAQPASYPSPPWEDSFMSWEPLRHQNDWPKGGAL